MGMFKGKTAIISGASRGIGREIAIKLGGLGANVVLAAKTLEPHKYLEGTIMSVAKEVEQAGGKAMPYQIDVRDACQIEEMVNKVGASFPSIDVVINNAGAIYLSDTLSTDAKQYDLMHQVNARATFLLSRAAIPFLKKQGGHILNLSPPINLDARWLSPHVAYTISKFSMSMCTIGMADELREFGVGINSLWPKMLIYTAAVTRLLGEDAKKNCRKPAIMADAATWILSQDPQKITGNLWLDEDVMALAKIDNLSQYDYGSPAELMPDLYIS